MGLVLIILAIGGVAAWLLATALTQRWLAEPASRAEAGLEKLLAHASGALHAQDLDDAFDRARHCARDVLDVTRIVLIHLNDDRGSCRLVRPKCADVEFPASAWSALVQAPWHLGALTRDILGQPTHAEAGKPLLDLARDLNVDVFVPWIERGRLICIAGMTLKRPLDDAYDRALLTLWNMTLGRACAHRILERQGLYQRHLEQDVARAQAIPEALPSQPSEGMSGGLAWSVYERPAPRPGGGFWDIYKLADDRLLVIAGEVARSGLAASMLSIAIRSCCDTLFSLLHTELEPRRLLNDLNRFLWRSSNPIGIACLAVLFDQDLGVARYAVAGPVGLWRLRWQGAVAAVEPCPGAGPLVGASADTDYQICETKMAPGSAFFLVSERLSQEVWCGVEAGRGRRETRFDGAEALPPRALRIRMLDALDEDAQPSGSVPLIVVRTRGIP